MDLRVLKYFPFGESRRLDLVAEFFNLFNHANVAQINPVFGSNLIPISAFGQRIEGAGARRILDVWSAPRKLSRIDFFFRRLRAGQKIDFLQMIGLSSRHRRVPNMRMLLKVSIPVEAGNAAARSGSLGSTITRILRQPQT